MYDQSRVGETTQNANGSKAIMLMSNLGVQCGGLPAVLIFSEFLKYAGS